MPFAVVQHGYAVFGLGATKAEAIEDARRWVDNPDEIDDLPSRPDVDGDLYIAECTEALAVSVERKGGQIAHTLRHDGIVCLKHEEY